MDIGGELRTVKVSTACSAIQINNYTLKALKLKPIKDVWSRTFPHNVTSRLVIYFAYVKILVV